MAGSTGSTAEIMRKLVAIRKGSGIEVRHVAQRMHTSTNNVYQIEARASRNPHDLLFGTVVAYMRAINVRLSYEIIDEPGGAS